MGTQTSKRSTTIRMWLFPAAVLLVYLVLFLVVPDKAALALKSSGNIIFSMLLSLGMVFLIMLLINIFLKPAQIIRFLGKNAGVKGILFSIAAGIISSGPIYAWYPLLKELKEKGAGNHILAIFLYNRAVKPFLLPVMIYYFGWLYVVLLTFLMILSSIASGRLTACLVKDRPCNNHSGDR
ncbi:MAG: hypothetical protein JXA46_14250 [Dehalococcoidales bacterium]|nr:hypothetical protein [Dehalococcoidales bacterium]